MSTTRRAAAGRSTKGKTAASPAPKAKVTQARGGKRARRDESEEEETSYSSSDSSIVAEEQPPKLKVAKITGSGASAGAAAKARKAPERKASPPAPKSKKASEVPAKRAPAASNKRKAESDEDEDDDEDEDSDEQSVTVEESNNNNKRAKQVVPPAKGKKDDKETKQVAPAKGPKAQPARAPPKKTEESNDYEEEEEDEEEEDEEHAVPKTPKLDRAQELCMSVKRHLARPLDMSEAVDQTLVPQTPRVSKLRGSEVVAKSDYDELLERFHELKALRTTKSEKMYAKLQAASEAREKASAKFIESLKSENKRLQQERDAAVAKQEKEKKEREVKEERAEGDAKQQQAHQQQLEQANATLRFLRHLTLIDAKPHPAEGANAFLCSCKNPSDKRALTFVLTVADDSVEYKPIEIGKQPNWEMNEMFVKEIYFGPQFAPIFLSKLLATVYGTKKATK